MTCGQNPVLPYKSIYLASVKALWQHNAKLNIIAVPISKNTLVILSYGVRGNSTLNCLLINLIISCVAAVHYSLTHHHCFVYGSVVLTIDALSSHGHNIQLFSTSVPFNNLSLVRLIVKFVNYLPLSYNNNLSMVFYWRIITCPFVAPICMFLCIYTCNFNISY